MAVRITADVSGPLAAISDAIKALQEIQNSPEFVRLILKEARPTLEYVGRYHLIRQIDARTNRRTGKLRSSAKYNFHVSGREIVGSATFPATRTRHGQYGHILNNQGRHYVEAATAAAGRDPRNHAALSRAAVNAFNTLLARRLR